MTKKPKGPGEHEGDDQSPPRRDDPFAGALRPPAAAPTPSESAELQTCNAAVALGITPLIKALDAYLDKHPADPMSADFRDSVSFDLAHQGVVLQAGRYSSTPAALRAALELAMLWRSPRRAPDWSIIEIAFHIAGGREKDMEDLCAIIRGTWVRPPESRLPWRVLRPFAKLPWLGQVIGGSFDGDPEQLLPPPGKETIRRLPAIAAEYQRLLRALEGVMRAAWNLGVLSRIEVRRDGASRAPRRYTDGPARKDTILDPRVIESGTWANWYHGRVEDILKAIDVLNGGKSMRPHELYRDAANLATIRRAATAVLALVLKATHDPRSDAGRQHDRRREHGRYRGRCLARTFAIAAAIYGKDLAPNPEQLKSSAQKVLSRLK
jgi:hypothetical protein